MTIPWRSRLKGRQARAGSDPAGARTRITFHAARTIGVSGASAPPARIRSASPARRRRNAWPMAWVPDEQATANVRFSPLRRSSVARTPAVALAIAVGMTVGRGR